MKTAAGIEADRKEGTAQLFGKTIKVDQKLEELGEGQNPDVIRMVIPFQIKSLDDETRTIKFVGSTAKQDRYGDVIVQTGWDLQDFIKNPVIPWGHNYSQPPVGKALEVGLEHGELTFVGQFATKDEYEFADTIYKLYKGGYLRAFSVGFIPLDWEGDWSTGFTFTKCELLEVSCVTVPANPEALVLAYKEGVLSEAERKGMIGHAEKLIKTLTNSKDNAQNEDMETANAIKELTGIMTEVRDLLVSAKDEQPEDGKENPEGQEPEGAESDKPADKPAGGADDEPKEGDELDEGAATLSVDDIRGAIRGATKEVLDYQLGKIN